MTQRKIVQIDEEKCDGCGLCVSSCAEGAIQVIDGKAKLVSDVYCDGLGACLGHCPQDAITVIEREATQFDEEAARQHVARALRPKPSMAHARQCPGSIVQSLKLQIAEPRPGAARMPGRCLLSI